VTGAARTARPKTADEFIAECVLAMKEEGTTANVYVLDMRAGEVAKAIDRLMRVISRLQKRAKPA